MNVPLISNPNSPNTDLLNTASLLTAYSLGLDLGGTSVKGVAVTPAGETTARFHEPFNLDEPLAFARCVSRVVAQATQQLGRPARIGLSAPGIAAADRRSIAHMPGRFVGLEGFNWSEFFDRPEGLPVLNDAQAALLGEVWLGAARGAREVILLTLGTGVGGAALVNGKLLRGHSGKAGHLGHLSLKADGVADICGTPGSLEDSIGNHNISTRSNGRFATTHDLICAHKNGDAAATEIWLRSVRALAAALASFGNILDPEVAVIGGGIAGAGEALFGPLREYLSAMEWRPAGTGMHIVPAELGEFAGAYGAAWQAGQHENH
jgi:glucokinase